MSITARPVHHCKSRPLCVINPLGIYDLHGNVWEWTSTPEGSSRVFRGGGWHNYAEDCTASNRDWSEPGFRNSDLGFRVLAVPSGAN